MSNPHSLIKINKDVLFVFVLLALVYGYFFQDPGWNGYSHLGLTFAIVRNGHFYIDAYQAQPGLSTNDKAFFEGHYYSDKAIGSSLVAALYYFPIYWLEKLLHLSITLNTLKYLLTFLTIGLPSALLGSLIYSLGIKITKDRTKSFFVTMAIALGTMSMPYSVIFFSHQLSATFLFCAFYMIFQLRRTPLLGKPHYLFIFGFILGFGVITEYPTALIAFFLVIYFFYIIWNDPKLRRISNVIWPFLGGLIPIAFLMVYNTFCFGHPFNLGYANEATPVFQTVMSQGIMGFGFPKIMPLIYMTIHPAQGIFWQSPVLLLALVGFYYMFQNKTYRAEAILILTIFIVYLLVISGYSMWWGGWAFGPRHLVPMLPFLSLPLLFTPKKIFPLVVVLTAISIAQMLIVAASVVQTPDNYIGTLGKAGWFHYSNIYSACLKQLLEGKFNWNLGIRLLKLKQWTSLLPLLAFLLGGSGGFLFRPQTRAKVAQG